MIVLLDVETAESSGIRHSLEKLGANVATLAAADDLHRAERIIIPHATSYRRALASLRNRGLVTPLLKAIDAGCPVLAIGSGMHLLFDVMNDENQHTGLGVVHGRVKPLDFGEHPAARHFTLPHQGWNQVFWTEDCPILTGLRTGEYFYFDHSGQADPSDSDLVAATSNHGIEFPAVVRRDAIYGVQFMPERSDAAGQTLIANFLNCPS